MVADREVAQALANVDDFSWLDRRDGPTYCFSDDLVMREAIFGYTDDYNSKFER